jgi:flavoprotein
MALRNETKKRAHNREEFIDYVDLHIGNFEKGIYDSDIKVKLWGIETYRGCMKQCMNCGCPEDNINMKNSANAFYCLVCEKKLIGENAFNSKQEKLNKWIDKSSGMNLKEILQTVKKSLIFG